MNIKNLKFELEMSERKMLRLKRRGLTEALEPEELSLWAMLDLMTLILVFFIILYANLLPVHPPKILEHLSKQRDYSFVKYRFGVHTPKILEHFLKPDTLVKEAEPDPESEMIPENTTDFLTIEENMHQVMEGTDISDYSIETIGNRIVLVIGEKISFPVGQAELLDNIKGPLKKMAVLFSKEQTYKIIVSGHTDDTPIHTTRFPSNWDLSVGRALSVANFLMEYNVDPRRIAVEGFGQYRPLADNEDSAGRQANRRVEISMIKEPF